jgi:hypothetical protein
MATVWAVNNGNWSNASTWSGSYIPQSGDDVFANNRTVNVDVSFDVASLRNTSGTGITAGGSFNFNSGSISGSVTAISPLSAGATNLITVTATTGSVGLALDELRSNFEQKIRAQLVAAVDRVMESVNELEWQAPVHSISYDLEEFPTHVLLKTTFELK